MCLDRLKTELEQVEAERNELRSRCTKENQAAGTSDDALKRAQHCVRSLRKELKETQQALDQQAADAEAAAAKWKKSFESEKVKTVKLVKELESANSTLEQLRKQIESSKHDKELADLRKLPPAKQNSMYHRLEP